MPAFCKDCWHIYTRELDEWQEMVVTRLKEEGTGEVPYWGCRHPRTSERPADKFGFVSCESMRLNGAPCSPEGVLFEERSVD